VPAFARGRQLSCRNRLLDLGHYGARLPQLDFSDLGPERIRHGC